MGSVCHHNADVHMIACGINYDNGHKFRSTAIVEFGIPYRMPEEVAKLYDDPVHKREVVSDFLNVLSRPESYKAKRLLDVKITAANQTDLKMLYIMRDLYLSDEGKVDKESKLKIMRNFKENYENANNQDDMKVLRNRMTEYMLQLKHCGVKDWELKTLDTSTFKNILILLRAVLFVISFCTIVDSTDLGHPWFHLYRTLQAFPDVVRGAEAP